MNDDICFVALTPPAEPCPNTARKQAELVAGGVRLTYEVSPFEGGQNAGCMLFKDVAMFRVGNPNDEGFYGGGNPGIINDSMYNRTRFRDLAFDAFYEVLGYDWTNGLTGTCYDEVRVKGPSLESSNNPIVLIDNAKPADGFRHFVFFMKDGTFECVCKDWSPCNA